MRNLFFTLSALFLLTLSAIGQKRENLVIVWSEEYKWKVGSNQEDKSVHMIELIPGDEKIDKWTMMGTMMSFKGAKNVPMDLVMNSMFDQAKKNAPNATLTFIERSDNIKNYWIIFKIESPRFNNDKTPESQLYYVVQGETSLYSNFIAIKEKTLSDDFVETWKGIFKKSTLIYE